MAYDDDVAARVRGALGHRRDVQERKMFGGLAFLAGGHMCCGVLGNRLMARVGPGQYAAALARPHVRPMDFTGRPLTGFVYVDPPGFRTRPQLDRWIARCTAFVDGLPARERRRRRA